jgi:site-specific DNA recombinase
MTPAQVSRGNRRYRYYTCSAAQRKGWHTCPSKSLPAGAVERYVLEQIASRMPVGRGQVQPPATEGPSDQRRRLRDCVARIDYDGTTGEMAITLNTRSSSLKESA